MSPPRIRLYGIPLSHPTMAVRGMLERTGRPYRYTELLAGTHPAALLALGFRGVTVPAVRLADGRRVQGSLAIARALDELSPGSLYPDPPQARAAAERAERWGEAELQPVPRRLVRWELRCHLRQRQWFAEVATPLPAPAVMGALLSPLASVFARQAGASDARVRDDLAGLPEMLDTVDGLLADGVVGSDPGAADFQIAASIRVLAAMDDVGQLVRGRPAADLAYRLVPDVPTIPAGLPAEWLPPADARTQAG